MNKKVRRVSPEDKSDLAKLMDSRQETIFEVQDLQAQVKKIEDNIKGKIIRAGQTDLLKVDWTRVSRAFR